jgi:hypothetical protein
MNILFLLIVVILGVLIEFNVYAIVRVVGRMSWAEVKFGPGGTFFAWRLIGLALIIGSFIAYRYL